MHHFAYRDGVLHAEAVNLAAISRAVGTPFYCYSTATLERHYRVFAEAFADVPSLVCYAMKANSNQAVIATLARLGAGADVVSEGELKRARAAGVPTDKIMFSGVGKTERELALAVDEGILCVNVESEPELDLLSAISTSKPMDEVERARIGRQAAGFLSKVRLTDGITALELRRICGGMGLGDLGRARPPDRQRHLHCVTISRIPGMRVRAGLKEKRHAEIRPDCGCRHFGSGLDCRGSANRLVQSAQDGQGRR